MYLAYLSGSTELCLTSQHLTRESSQAVGRDGLDGFFSFFLGFTVVIGLGVTSFVFFSSSLSFIVFLPLPFVDTVKCLSKEKESNLHEKM